MILLSFLLFIQHANSSSHFSDKKVWQKCEKDSDCVLADDICGGYISVNTKHCDEYYKWREKVATALFCSNFVAGYKSSEAYSVCQKSLCTVVNPTPSKSDKEESKFLNKQKRCPQCKPPYRPKKQINKKEE